MTQTLNKHLKINVPYKVKARKTGEWDLYEDLTITKDGPRDFNYIMTDYDGLDCSFDFSGDYGVIDSSNTILPWKYDYNNKFDINNYTFDSYKNNVKQYNFTTIGSVIIDNNGVLSETTENNYLTLGQKSMGTNNYEMIFKFKYKTNNNDHAQYFSTLESKWFCFGINIPKNTGLSGDVIFSNSGDSSWVSYNGGTTILQDGMIYWAKLKRFNGTRYMYLSTDGKNWNLENSVSDSYSLSSANLLLFVDKGVGSSKYYGQDGKVYLTDSFVNINNESITLALIKNGCLYHYEDVTEEAVTLKSYVTNKTDKLILSDIDIESPEILNYRKYYKYIDSSWSQPVFSANTLTYEGIDYTLSASHEANPAWWAFNESETGENAWWTNHGISSDTNPCWIQFHSSVPLRFTSVYIENENASPCNFKHGYFQVSTDGLTWENKAELIGVDTTAAGITTDVDLDTYYNYFRLWFNESYNDNGNGISIQIIRFSGYKRVIGEGTAEDYDYYEDITFDSLDYLGTVDVPDHMKEFVDLDNFEYTQTSDFYKLNSYIGTDEDLTFVTERVL